MAVVGVPVATTTRRRQKGGEERVHAGESLLLSLLHRSAVSAAVTCASSFFFPYETRAVSKQASKQSNNCTRMLEYVNHECQRCTDHPRRETLLFSLFSLFSLSFFHFFFFCFHFCFVLSLSSEKGAAQVWCSSAACCHQNQHHVAAADAKSMWRRRWSVTELVLFTLLLISTIYHLHSRTLRSHPSPPLNSTCPSSTALFKMATEQSKCAR